MSVNQINETLYKIPILQIECSIKTLNFYANTIVKNHLKFILNFIRFFL